MARKIVITSGKGGAGKTTVTANLGFHLAKKGLRTVVLDCDLGLNNLDVLTGVENLVNFDLIDVINGRCRAKQALIESPLAANLFVLPSAHTMSETEVSGQRIRAAIEAINLNFDFILIDCPAGIDVGFHRAVSVADEALLVVNPVITSIRDADKVSSLLKSYKIPVSAVVNRIRGDLVLSGESFSAEDIGNTLGLNVSSVIPEDDAVLSGIADLPSSAPYKAFSMLAASVNGEKYKIYNYLKKYSGFFGSIRRDIRKKL